MGHRFNGIFLTLWLMVITDPYKGLDYDEINVYDFPQEYIELGMTYHEADTSDYVEEEEIEECESSEPAELPFWLRPR